MGFLTNTWKEKGGMQIKYLSPENTEKKSNIDSTILDFDDCILIISMIKNVFSLHLIDFLLGDIHSLQEITHLV